MSAPPVGTRVTEGTRCGTVVAHRPQEMVDVTFDDLSYPIRRPAANLITIRGNPFPSRRNPDVKPVFLCAVLTSESKRLLYKWWMSQPLAPEPLAIQRSTHMTIKFNPSEAEFDAASIGKEVTLSVIGWAANSDIQAVAVTPNGVTSTKVHPHITFTLREPSIPAKLSDSILDGTVKGMVQAARGPSLVAHIGWSDGKVYYTTRQPLSNPGPRGGLSSRERASLPDSAFALPGRRWPIPDRNHAKIAKTYMARGFGRHADYPQIQRAISDRFQMNPAPEPYDPAKEQFRAVVQGVYESLVSKELGIPRPEPFILPDGTRPDSRLVPDTRRRLLSSAYAIATRQGQRHGWLKEGTQTPTERGIKASAIRANDPQHAATNRQDYEQTLGAVRKSGHFRVVQEMVEGSKRFIVQPRPTHVNIPEYRMTLEAAQGDADKANSSFTRWNPRPVRVRRNPDPTPRHYYVSTLRALVSRTLYPPPPFPSARYGCTDSELESAQTALGSVFTQPSKNPKLVKAFTDELSRTKNLVLRTILKLDEPYYPADPPKQAETPEWRVSKNLKYLFASREIKQNAEVVDEEPPAYRGARLAKTSQEAALLQPFLLWVGYLSAWWSLHGSLWLRQGYERTGTPDVRYVSAEQIDAHTASIDIWREAEVKVRAGCDAFKTKFKWASSFTYENFYALLNDLSGLPAPIDAIQKHSLELIKAETLKTVLATEVSFRRFETLPPAPIYRVTITSKLDKDAPTRTDTRTVLKAGLRSLLEKFRLDESLSPYQVEKGQVKAVLVRRFDVGAWDYKNTLINVPRTGVPFAGFGEFQVVDSFTGQPANPQHVSAEANVSPGPSVYRDVLKALGEGEQEKSVLPQLRVETFILGLPQSVEKIGVSPKVVSPEARTPRQDDALDTSNAERELTKKLAAEIPDGEKAAYYDIEQVFTISYEEPSISGSGTPRTQYRTIAMRPKDKDAIAAYKRVHAELIGKQLPGLPSTDDPTLKAYETEVRYVIYIRRTPRFIRRLMYAGSTIALAAEATTNVFGRVRGGNLPIEMNKPPTAKKTSRKADQSYTSSGVSSQGASDRGEKILPSALLKHFFTVDAQQLRTEEDFINSGENTDPRAGYSTPIDTSSVSGFDSVGSPDGDTAETDYMSVEKLISMRHTTATDRAKDSRVFLRNTPDNNWVPYRSKINESRRRARGEWNQLENKFEKDTLYTNPFDVYFTKNAGLAYLTILYFQNPAALGNFVSGLVEPARVFEALEKSPFSKVSDLLVDPAYTERTRARLAVEHTYSQPLPLTQAPSVTKDVADRTLLGKLFTFGLGQGTVLSMQESAKMSESSPYTIQGQRMLSMASAPPKAPETQPAPQETRIERPKTEPSSAVGTQFSVDDFTNNPRRPVRRFR